MEPTTDDTLTGNLHELKSKSEEAVSCQGMDETTSKP